MASQFDEEGKHFAQLSTDGKLKIWNIISNTFEQEFTPDYHLTSPCTCLRFTQANHLRNKVGSPKKKKRRDSLVNVESPNIVLGTKSGHLIVYSIAKGEVESTIDSETNQAISCLSSCDDETFYSGVDQNIVVWNILSKKVISKWKSGNEKISSILAIKDSEQLLTASKNIKLWNINNKSVLKTLTGHSSEISILEIVYPKGTSSDVRYLISGSKGDRLLSCWNINNVNKEKNAIANFLLEDTVHDVCYTIGSDGTTRVAATNRSGGVHVFQHVLNGKCNKPVKPKITIQVVSDTGQNNGIVHPIPIVGTVFKDAQTLCIGHGNAVTLTFEDVDLSSCKKLECLLRKDPRTTRTNENQVSKTQIPLVGKDVHYVTPHTKTTTVKRKNDGKLEVPMEKRLENLTLNNIGEGSKVPKSDNVAQLLLQGLHSKDKNIIKAVLCKRDEHIIKNTVRRLPINVIVQLVRELTTLIQGKTISSQIGSLWLRHLIQTHAALLISNPDLPELLGPALGTIESRLTLQTSLNRLRGRLDLLITQVSSTVSDGAKDNDEALLLYNDKGSSDSEEEVDLELQTESENEWNEESSAGEDDNEMVDDAMSDEEISS